MQENSAFKKHEHQEKVYTLTIISEFCHFWLNKNIFMKKKKEKEKSHI